MTSALKADTSCLVSVGRHNETVCALAVCAVWRAYTATHRILAVRRKHTIKPHHLCGAANDHLRRRSREVTDYYSCGLNTGSHRDTTGLQEQFKRKALAPQPRINFRAHGLHCRQDWLSSVP